MRWVSKNVVKPPREMPFLGKKREIVWFAIFPVKIGNEWVWLEKYIKVQQYTIRIGEVYVLHHEGFIFDTWRRKTVEARGWETIERKLI